MLVWSALSGMKVARCLFWILTLVLFLSFGTLPSWAETPKVRSVDVPQRILFVGNSFTYYNNSLHSHLRNLLKAAGIYKEGKTRLRAMTISGSKLVEHAGGIASMVKPDLWDLVVLHGHSMEPLQKSTAQPFIKVAGLFSKYIRENGAEPVFFMTWAYSGRPEMLQPLAKNYTKLANKLDALVVPVGIAFAKAQRDYPNIELYARDLLKYEAAPRNITATPVYQDEVKHPSLAGTYLAACVFYAALFRQSPVGLAYRAGLDRAEATSLQQVSLDTVEAFYAAE